MTDTVTTPARPEAPAREGSLPGRLGDSALRPDGVAKVQGSYEFSGDLHADGFLWGATLRSPHPYARIVGIDLSAAWQIEGVAAIVGLIAWARLRWGKPVIPRRAPSAAPRTGETIIDAEYVVIRREQR